MTRSPAGVRLRVPRMRGRAKDQADSPRKSGRDSVIAWKKREGRCRLFLHRHLVLDVAPGADFETPANPAQRFLGTVGGFGAAHRALAGRLLRTVRRDRLAGQFQDFRRNYRFGFCVRLASHGIPVLIPLWQKPHKGTSDFRVSRTKRAKRPFLRQLPESAQSPQPPAAIGIAGNALPGRLWPVCPVNQARPEPCGCRSGKTPDPVCGPE